MNGEQQVMVRKRRTRAEVQQLVADFVSSGMRRSEFCRSRGLSFGTLDRHLKKRPWKRKTRSTAADSQLLAVELAIKKSPSERDRSCALAVVYAERYFSEVLELNPQDPLATPIVKGIDELFAIDAQARQQGLSLEARDALRQEQARPLLEVIRQEIQTAYRQVLPGSQLAKACKYTLSLWDKLTRFLEYPELELSNNLAENSMRPVAVGRRNWIHIGSLQA